MSKATIKQILKIFSVLQDNLPKEEIDNLDSEIAQKIIDSPQVSGEEFMRFLKNGAHVQVVGNHIINCDANPFIPKGWSVEKHKKSGQFTWDPNKIKLYFSENQKNGKVIHGHALREELANQPVLNANVLDYLLQHPELILEEWKGKLIFFWGTIYRHSDGGLCVRYLRWGGKRWDWVWFCHWLDDDWDDGFPAAVSAGVS